MTCSHAARRKAIERLEGRNFSGRMSVSAGSVVAASAVSKTLCGSAAKNPETTSTTEDERRTTDDGRRPSVIRRSSNGCTSSATQLGSRRTPASVEQMMSPEAARMAALRPCEIFAPGSERTRNRFTFARSMSSVVSLEPPSTTMISSGARVCAAIESRRRGSDLASFFTVTINETRTRAL